MATPEAVPTEVPEPAAELTLVPIVEGLERPTAVAAPDDGTGDLYVVEQAGRILRLAGGSGPAEVALDIRDRVGSQGNEQGLLGLAFHPAVADNGRLFVDYTDLNGDTIVAEYELRDGRISPRSERVVLKVSQPAANHNGGDLHFGPDGMLYVSFGDGGGSNSQNGHRRDTLLGKILRLDVTGRPDDGLGLRRPGRQPVRRPGWRAARDLGDRPAQPVALLHRARERRPVDRRRRRGRAGGGRPCRRPVASTSAGT